MANVLAPLLARPDEAWSLLRAIYTTEADLLPDPPGRHPDRSPPPSGQWRLGPRRPHTLWRVERDRDRLPTHQPPLDPATRSFEKSV